MFFPEANVRVFLYGQPVDMRKSYDGLYALARHGLHQDPLAGHLFAFINRRGTQIKVLYFGVSRTRAQARDAVSEMGDGLPESACRSRLQTARCCCVEKAWW
jgi:transposase